MKKEKLTDEEIEIALEERRRHMREYQRAYREKYPDKVKESALRCWFNKASAADGD